MDLPSESLCMYNREQLHELTWITSLRVSRNNNLTVTLTEHLQIRAYLIALELCHIWVTENGVSNSMRRDRHRCLCMCLCVRVCPFWRLWRHNLLFFSFSGVYFQGTTIGMAPIMSMCTAEQSGGIVMVRTLHSVHQLSTSPYLPLPFLHLFPLSHMMNCFL